jgi:uncharacterized repeat protein (TIGR03803 family)
MIQTRNTGWLRVRRSGVTMLSVALLAAAGGAAQADGQTFSVLHNFSGPDGAAPQSVLIMDSSGNLYGTTANGGSGGYGTAFKLDSSAALTPLTNLSTSSGDGYSPYAGLVLYAGNLYGTTYQGGSSYCGTVFKIDSNGVLSTVYNFPGGADGAHPAAALIADGAGNLYGTTYSGGTGYGTVFALNLSTGTLTWTHALSYNDGANPEAGLVLDSTSGNLYGTTYFGGSYGQGTVFTITTSGAGFAVLHTFSGADGGNPYGGLVRDSSGNLYGTTVYGGTAGYGTVFKLETSAVLTTLYSFTNGTDGGNPNAGLAIDRAGNHYGVAEHGGNSTATGCQGGYYSPPGCGTVFELTSSSGNYSFKVVHTFTYGDGANPLAGLFIDSTGNIYGTTLYGGTPSSGNPYGTVFKIQAESPQAMINALINQVNALLQSGALNSGQDNSLVAHLQQALNMLGKSNTTPTIAHLQAFVNEVQGLENAGALTPTEAQSLIDAANAVIALL